MQLVFLDTETLGNVTNLHLLEQFGNLVTFPYTAPEQVVERSKGHEIVITNKVLFSAGVIDQLPGLKLIALTATGMNNVDLEHARENGVKVMNVAGYSTESVAQATFGMILQLINQTRYYDDYVKSGQYANHHLFCHVGKGFWELKGKTFGIIGMGTIGNRVAEIARAFGCDVVYHSTSGKNHQQPYPCLSLEQLLQSSDVVSIHAPLNDQTRGLVDGKMLGLMKPGAVIVNAGRGGIINEKDLANAIDNDIIAGAAIDVYEKEPISVDSPFMQMKKKDKMVFAPHTAWASIEARNLLVEKLCDNIKSYIHERTSQ